MRALTAYVFSIVLAVALAPVAAVSGPLEDGRGAYERGDCAAALRWWRPLAGYGCPGARNDLGVMCRDGLGIQRDDMRFHIWFSLAVSRFPPGEDRDGSAQGRDGLAKFMSPDQIAWAEKRVRMWKPRDKEGG